MQTFSYELIRHISKYNQIKTITWGMSQFFLPWFLMKALFLGLFYIKIFRISVVHLGDSVLSPLGVIFKFFFNVKVAVTAHGLDVIFPLRAYQFVLPKVLNRLDCIFAVSNHTKSELLSRGITNEKIYFIPNGINPPQNCGKTVGEPIEEFLFRKFGLKIKNKKLLLTVGRLVKRKGHIFFIEEVLRELIKIDPDIIYCIVGEGKEKRNIIEAINRLGLCENVALIGGVDQENLRKLYHAADLFIMPNVPVAGDSEGFGIVALEASAHKLPVVAADLEGIKDAIHDKKNGFLVPASSASCFIDRICKLLSNLPDLRKMGEKFYLYTVQNFSWKSIASKYLIIINKQ